MLLVMSRLIVQSMNSDLASDLSGSMVSRQPSTTKTTSEINSIQELDEVAFRAVRDLAYTHFGGPGSQDAMSDHSSDIVLSECGRTSPLPSWDKPTREYFIQSEEPSLENQRGILGHISIFRQNTGAGGNKGRKETQRTTSSSSDPLSSAQMISRVDARFGGHQRPRKQRAKDDDHDEQDSDGEIERYSNHSQQYVGTIPRRLACPYFKRNPQKYQQERSCSGPGWNTVHRIKYVFCFNVIWSV